MKQFLSGAFLRFFAVNLLGIGTDIALAFLLHAEFGLPLSWSAAGGLLCAAGLMYLLHEFWTFRTTAARFSAARLSQFIASSLAILAVRQAILWTLHGPLGFAETWVLLQLVIAAGFSFIISYFVSQNLVFRR